MGFVCTETYAVYKGCFSSKIYYKRVDNRYDFIILRNLELPHLDDKAS